MRVTSVTSCHQFAARVIAILRARIKNAGARIKNAGARY